MAEAETVTVADREVGRPSDPSRRWRLRLFGGFELRCGRELLVLPPNSQRLIAFLGLRSGATRAQAAGVLWPEVSERQAGGRLRTTLWRVQGPGREILDGGRDRLALGSGVEVDVRDWLRGAREVLDGSASVAAARLVAGGPVGELLPGWYEDWVLIERERLRQLQLHALEAASGRLLDDGLHAEALDAAIGVLGLEPTRESAHRAAIRVHLAEGNIGEARRQFESCRGILARELGVGPSPLLQALLPQAEPGAPGEAARSRRGVRVRVVGPRSGGVA